MALLLFGVSVLGTYPGTPQDPVALELTRSLSRGDSSARQRAGKQWRISVVIDLCGFSFPGFSPLYY